MGISLVGKRNECDVGQMEFEIFEEQLYGNFIRELELGCASGKPELAMWSVPL